MNRPNRPQSYAFTLVELLVVIGIIGVLIAILIPVVSRVRIAAQNAATQNMLVTIGSAIEQYYHDNGAYPGATPDSMFGTGAANLIDPNVTGPESLTIALVGGEDVTYNNGVGKPTFNKDLLGNGPISLNPLAPGQKKAYFPYRKEQFSVGLCKNDPALSYVVGDSAIPEFIDAYSDPQYRPILYLRANPGAKQGDKTKIVSDTYRSDVHYNLQPVKAYFRTNTTDPTKSDIFVKGAADPAVIDYFSGPISNGSTLFTARSAGSFILISAGPDHIYGTADDIIQAGGGGQ